MTPKLINVVANNSPHKGQNIVVYKVDFIELFIRGYALALAHRKIKYILEKDA